MGKPVLLSVDDDPGVSRAVARDLRRNYGEGYRVLRASSAAEGLEALREPMLRGDLGCVADAPAPSHLEPALRWLASTVEVETPLLEIADSTSRISALLDAASTPCS